MDSRIRGPSALGYVFGVGIALSIGHNVIPAVYFVVVPVLTAFETGIHLRPSTDTLADFCRYHLGSHAEDLSDEFVANGQRVGDVALVSAKGMYVVSAYGAAFNFNINVVITKRTRLL